MTFTRGSPAHAFDQLLGAGATLPRAPVAGRGEIEEDLAHQPACRPLVPPGPSLLEDVHVAESGRARRIISAQASSCPGIAQFGVPVFGLGGEDVVVQPVHERQVVRDAPEAGHGRMGVGVDEPGHDDPTLRVDHARDAAVREIPGIAEGDDAIARDADGSARQGAAGRGPWSGRTRW